MMLGYCNWDMYIQYKIACMIVMSLKYAFSYYGDIMIDSDPKECNTMS